MSLGPMGPIMVPGSGDFNVSPGGSYNGGLSSDFTVPVTGLGSIANSPVTAAAVGGLFNYFSQDEANETNVKLARMTQDFQSSMWDKGALFNANEADKSRLFNAQEAEKARGWSKMMSDTAVERQVESYRRAGINPILAADFGGASSSGGVQASGPSASGPSTPSGSTAHVESTRFGDVIKGMLSTAMDVQRLKNETESTESLVNLNRATKLVKDAERAHYAASALDVLEHKKHMELENERMENERPAWQMEHKARFEKAKRHADHPTLDYVLEKGGQMFGITRDAAITAAAGATMVKGKGGIKMPAGTGLIDLQTGELLKEMPLKSKK